MVWIKNNENFIHKEISEVCVKLSFCDYDLLGKVIFDVLDHEDNFYRKLGKSLVSVF